MLNLIRHWYTQKLTLMIAPGKGSRSFQFSISYPFATFLFLFGLGIFGSGLYFSKIYLGYLQAVETNKKLVHEKTIYAQQLDETLDILQNVKGIEAKLRGMLGMKSQRTIIENYAFGGPHASEQLGIPSEVNELYERVRFNSNVSEIKREAWEQQQSVKQIENFIDKKRNILLSTPSVWPSFGYITSKFGWRTNPITKKREYHKGLDMYSVLERNTPIRATARGKTIVAGWAGSFGKMVIISHGHGFSTRYSHCSKIIVKQGEEVEQGQIVAYIGNTGMSTGPHLHYEVWHRGKPVNPIRFVQGR
jgi:murein DD-endopeptidase MepM/ murein hydrolase activator NlpD